MKNIVSKFAFFELSFCIMSLTVSSCDIWENMVAQMISSLNFKVRHRLSPGKYTGKVLKPKKGVGTLWLTKYFCPLGTGI